MTSQVPGLDLVRRSLIVDSGLREPIVDRAFKRLGDVVVSDGSWQVIGRPELGDSFHLYTVRLDGEHYSCTCYGHDHGDSRQRQLCSHVIAVIAARRLGRAQVRPASQRLSLTPADLGMPAKFDEFRLVQTQALNRIQGSDKRFIMLQGATGSGKTLIAACLQRLLKTRVLYCCHTKQLQQQFISDFHHDLNGDSYAVELKGRENYPTLRYPRLFPRIHCGLCLGKRETHCRWCCDGNCGVAGEICARKPLCPYRRQKAWALASDLAVVNMALLLLEANYVGGFSGWPWLCLDEADLIERQLMSFVSLEITKHWIDRLGIEPPSRKTVQEAWVGWARSEAVPAVTRELAGLQNQYGVENIRQQQELERMLSKLNFFLEEVAQPGRWKFMPTEDRWTFKPVFVNKYAGRYLWAHAGRFLLMSATIVSVDEMCYSLGIPKQEVEFIDLPSTFDAKRRPIYYLPSANITKKTEVEERPKAIAALDKILDEHPEVKVLVHTKSYGYARQVVSMSRHRKRMVTYDRAKDRSVKLEEFKKAPLGAVLVASSMDRGVSLDGDLCRIVVIMKVPYGDLGDKQISARLHSDKKGGRLWYVVNTVRDLVQQSGRHVRSQEDWGDTYILDSQFERLFRENKTLFPVWWRAALHGLPGPGRSPGKEVIP